uniref:Uncharacterized protein n=1 Tax=Mycobacterium riyadhense TaxID=486698 RepID=A0A653F260_9MYCO|nr:hypothetical protein BIN_B_05286 [Mycobacterium riyadhense]
MPAEMFDAQRRAWIAAHCGVFMFQKRRAELLAKAIRSRARAQVGARPDPHDDQVTAPLFFRSASTATGSFESALVAVCALVAPVGWALGKALYLALVTLIPERLRAYPIPALLGSSAVCGLPLLLLYEPSPALSDSLIMPWLLGQLPATFLAAGIYGALEGWLAVDGSSDWWPLTPKTPDVDDDLILDPGVMAMPTVLDAPAQADSGRRIPPSLGARRRTPPVIRWVPIAIGGAAAATVCLWYAVTVIEATLNVPASSPLGDVGVVRLQDY